MMSRPNKDVENSVENPEVEVEQTPNVSPKSNDDDAFQYICKPSESELACPVEGCEVAFYAVYINLVPLVTV